MASITAKAAQEVLAADFQALVEDAEKLLEHSATLAGDQADVLRAQVRESLARAKASLHETEQAVLERGREAVDVTEAWVQNKPMQAVGIAAGLGFLIGLLATRR
ncbi:DUF883 family protein [Pseudomonas sp. KNUC1026]|uniref:DUF883 family protein n=1 Tax=Pseudomonas sp. KNUC1026 TaxID=2893890 RepID=UPI001F2A25B8|nr:DUF883 family protein [Pseudomonas sp. KNUC1026]UFH50654.1 DUF883 family protein [Pseudomonas sp. KNUC1026]